MHETGKRRLGCRHAHGFLAQIRPNGIACCEFLGNNGHRALFHKTHPSTNGIDPSANQANPKPN
jgi:hypothetical protein